MLVFALLFSCRPPCSTDIGAMSSVSVLEQSCSFPESQDKMWKCEHPFPTDRDIETLKELHSACGLDGLVDMENYATSGGDPLRAALIYDWLRSKGEPAAATAAALYLEPPPVPTSLLLPIAEDLAPVTLTSVKVVAEEVSGPVSWGDYPYWHLPGLKKEGDGEATGSVVAVTNGISIKTVRHLLASLASVENPLEIVVRSKQLSTVSLFLPSENDRIDDESQSDAPLRLELDNSQTVQELVDILSANPNGLFSLSLDHRPCLTPPDGMRCVPGSGDVETFYLDVTPTDNLKDCTDLGLCNGVSGYWNTDAKICASAGKRLPSHPELLLAEPEWESPSWTQTWLGKKDLMAPIGPCGGMPYCRGYKERYLSDGTTLHVGNRLRKGKVYCASSLPDLSGQQSFTQNETHAPRPLTVEPELAAFAAKNIRHDDLGNKDVCGEEVRKGWGESLINGGRSTLECRDPKSYITPNEPMRYLWAPHIENLGGGYAGVGSDQNYDFIAQARSEWVWLYDYDPNVNRLHHMLKALILNADTPEELVAFFAKENSDSAMSLIEAHYGDSAPVFVAFYRAYRGRLSRHYSRQLKGFYKATEFGWLANQESYAYVQQLHQQDRIIPVAGDMLATKGLRSIGETAKAMKVPIRIYYTSNAPTAWGGRLTQEYRDNVSALPFDDRSILLATYNTGGFEQQGYWHHSVASALELQRRINQGQSAFYLVYDRLPTDHSDLTLCQVPKQLSSLDWTRE